MTGRLGAPALAVMFIGACADGRPNGAPAASTTATLAGDATALPLEGKPSGIAPPPSGPDTGKGYGDEVPVGATPVTSCPLTPAGCTAAVSLLATIEAGDYGAIEPRVSITYPIGGKPGLDIVDAAALSRALDQARQELSSVAVGCPQLNGLGFEPGACNDLFVLAVPVLLPASRRKDRARVSVHTRRRPFRAPTACDRSGGRLHAGR